MRGLSGQTGIVTGGSAGIGRATAVRFGEEGARVVVADIAVDDGKETARLVNNAGGEAIFVETDVSDPAAVAGLVDAAVETFGELNFAFNNAGIEGTNAPVADQTDADWHRVIDINLTGVWLGMRYQIPAMLERGGGAIVNTASVAGHVGFPGLAPYVASKHGIIGLTRTAAIEYSGQGIRVNVVAPGVVDTEMVARTFADDPEGLAQLTTAAPIGRMGTPEEIAGTVAWLCSDDAAFVTGASIVVDGGYTAQ